MPVWTASLLAIVIAYLLGAVPTGYIAGRALRGIDIRDHGSRSTGATNVLRILGVGPAVAVLVVDMLKGAVAVLVAVWLCASVAHVAPEPAHWVIGAAGVAALVGHARSVWLRFGGGKSAATGLGVLLALSWPVGLGAAAVFGLVVALWRIVSLGSMLAAVTAAALAVGFALPLPYLLLVIGGGGYVVLRHRANIRRLLAGTEPRLGQAAPVPRPEA